MSQVLGSLPRVAANPVTTAPPALTLLRPNAIRVGMRMPSQTISWRKLREGGSGLGWVSTSRGKGRGGSGADGVAASSGIFSRVPLTLSPSVLDVEGDELGASLETG